MSNFRTGATALVTLLLFACLSAIAAEVARPESPPAPFEISNKFSRALQNYTGINRLTGLIASQIATTVIHHELGGKVKVKVRTFSLTDLLAGKVKGVDIHLTDCSYRGVPVSHVHLATSNPFWIHISKSHGLKAQLQNALLVKVQGQVSESNVSDALASPEISSALHMVKLDLPGLGKQQLQFLEPKVSLSTGNIAIQSTLVTAGAKPDTGALVTMSGCPYLDGSRIMVRKLKLSTPAIDNADDFGAFTQNLINPLIDLGKMDRLDHAFRLTALNVRDKKLDFDGNLLVAPKTKLKVAEQVVGK